MDNKAPLRIEALCRHALSLNCMRLGLESRMLLTKPVRFGRGRLDSLCKKGLAAYLIAKILRSGVRDTGADIAEGDLQGTVKDCNACCWRIAGCRGDEFLGLGAFRAEGQHRLTQERPEGRVGAGQLQLFARIPGRIARLRPACASG
jgi:hypothetical protein